MKLLVAVWIMMLIPLSAFADESKQEEAKLGLSAGVDFYTDYFWRGSDFYGENRGVVFPWVNMALGDTGFIIGYLGEYSQETFGDGPTPFEKIWYGADFSLEYAYTFRKMATAKAKYIYQWYYNSREENRRQNGYNYDESFMTGTLSFSLDALPLAPTVLYSRDYYMDDYGGEKAQGEDYYFQLQLSHTLALNDAASMVLRGGISYYDMASAKYSPTTREKRGISDATLAADLAVTSGGASFHGCINYAYVPDRDWYISKPGEKANRHRYWAILGASYAL